MSQHSASSADGTSVVAAVDVGKREALATSSQPATPLKVEVDAASLKSPDIEADESSAIAPSTPAPDSLDAANKQQTEDLKLKYGGVLPDRAALMRRVYQKEHRFVDSADQAMDKAGKVDPLRQPMTGKSALPPHMRNQ